MRKIPLRKCLVTGEQLPKQQLVRVVKNKNGEVFVDSTGKMNGRGAYLKIDKDCFEVAKKKKLLNRSLGINVPDEVFEELNKLL